MTQGRVPDEGLEETLVADSSSSTDGMAATAHAASATTSVGHGDAPPAEQPDRIGRYTIRGILGRGGMGVVYVGYDANLEREVAIKLVRAEAAGGSDGPTRLKREARIMAQLSHPNLVTVHEVGEHQGQVYVAMELVKGLTLRRWLRKQDRPWREILTIYLKAAHGLAAAHKVGVIHRDFKPDNVIVGDDGRVRVLDFGLARPVDAPVGTLQPISASDSPTSLTMTGAVMGTPAYMPPEQHEGKITDARADQFSYCVALFEALYGGRPFVGNSILELANATTSGTVTERPANTKVPRKLHDALLRGLKRDPNDRYDSMHDLSGELERRASSRNGAYIIGGAGAVVAAGLLGLFVYRGNAATPVVDETCKPVATKLADVWDQPAQQRLAQRFARLDKPYAAGVWQSMERDFNAYVTAWTSAQSQICDHTDKRDRLLRAQQLTCLDDHLLRMRAYIGATAEVDVNALALSFEGFNVATAAECVDANVVRARAPAAHAASADAVAEQLTRVYRAQTHIATHRFVRFSTLTPALISMKDASEKLKKLGHAATHAKALFYLGRALGYVDKTDQAQKVLVTAVEIAESNRADTTAAELRIRIVHHQAFGSGDKKALAANIKRARIALQRAGNPAMLVGQFLHTQAHIARLDQRFEKAVTLAKQAHTAFARALPPQSHRLALIESDLARFADLRRQGDVRLAHLSVAIDSFERFLGDQHPRLGEVLSRMARARFEDKATRHRGVVLSRRAARLLHNAAGHSSPWLGRAMVAAAQPLRQYQRMAEAHQMLSDAVRSLDKVFPRSGYALVRALSQTGSYEWHHLLDGESAERHTQRAIKLITQTYPDKNLAIMEPQLVLAAIRLAQGNYTVASVLATAVLNAPKRATGRDWPRPYRLIAAGLLARIAADKGNRPSALAYLEQMKEMSKGPREQAQQHLVAGHVFLSLKQLGRAINRFSAATKSQVLPGATAQIARGYLAIAHARAGKHKQAIPELTAAINRDPSRGHPLGIVAQFELAKLMWKSGRDRVKAKNHAKKARRSLKRYSPRRKRAQKSIDRWLKKR